MFLFPLGYFNIREAFKTAVTFSSSKRLPADTSFTTLGRTKKRWQQKHTQIYTWFQPITCWFPVHCHNHSAKTSPHSHNSYRHFNICNVLPTCLTDRGFPQMQQCHSEHNLTKNQTEVKSGSRLFNVPFFEQVFPEQTRSPVLSTIFHCCTTLTLSWSTLDWEIDHRRRNNPLAWFNSEVTGLHSMALAFRDCF